MGKILVAGAAGRVGRCVARRLERRGCAVRLLLHSPSTQALGAGMEAITADYNDPSQMAAAFASVDAAFMYAPGPEASHAVFQAARQAGVKQVVLLSSASVTKAAPGANPIAERHRLAEQAVQAAGLEWTFIRPDTMASNCLQWARTIREEARVYTPFPESMRNPIHEDDIAELAVQALLEGRHADRALDVTGPQVLTIRAQVECIAAQLGAAVECVPLERSAALERMAAEQPQLSRLAAERLLDYLEKSVSVVPRITEDFQRATGHAPRRFSAWVADHAARFGGAMPHPGS